MPLAETHLENINSAFSKQAVHFDEDDFSNPILQQWRQQVYKHIDQFIKPNSTILELNAGTGIDAVRFSKQGHRVHATDLSDGMISVLNEKIIRLSLHKEITTQQVSFDNLSQVEGRYDYVFSNFGGLNCLEDLTKVTNAVHKLLNEGAIITWVIMPPICLWEWSWILKGQFKKAFRRLDGKTTAHLEGEYFTTYYHSLSQIKKAFGLQFKFIKSEGLGIFSPPPSAVVFIKKYPALTKNLKYLDRVVQNYFPFNQWGDHIMVTFQYKG